MEPFFTLAGVCLVLYVLVAPLIAFLRARSVKSELASQRSETMALREQIRELTGRIYKLEKAAESAFRSDAATARRQTEAARPVEQALPPPSPAPPVNKPEPVLQVAPPTMVKVDAPTASPSVSPSRDVWTADLDDVNAVQKAADYFKQLGGKRAEAPPAGKRSLADIEEKLGANWLNKIGTAAFVIGVALLLNYSMHYLGPSGKIGLGYFLAALLLAAGLVGERSERYRIAGRAVLGGGWALAYFTTYALHNIRAVRLVDSPVLGFLLLFAVGVALVAHSLRYHSEVTTGFAYSLAFASLAVSEIPVGALYASALLAASLIVILRARHWFVIEPFAIGATYIVHWMWVNQIYERMGAHKPFSQFPTSVALLSVYWLIYLVSYFLRDETSAAESRWLVASFLVNAAGYLFVLHDQSFHPGWRFWFLLGSGVVYFGVSSLARHLGRRTGFVLGSTLGSALMIAAVPYRYSGERLEALWLAETEALLIAGWRLLDGHLRKLGWAGTTILTAYVLFYDVAPRLETWRAPDLKTGWILLAIAAAYYLNGQVKAKLEGQADFIDEIGFLVAPCLGSGFLLAALWFALPFVWTALAWAIAAFALVEIGARNRGRRLWWCGHASMALSVVRLLVVNLSRQEMWHNVSLRLLTVGLSGALLYLAARRSAFAAIGEWDTGGEGARSTLSALGGLEALYAGVGTLLFALLILLEATSGAVGLAWGLFGLALFETADALADKPLRWQARVMLLASFCRIFLADLNSTTSGWLHVPVMTVLILAAIYYYAGFRSDSAPRMKMALLWFGTVALAALVRFEMRMEWVAVGWAMLAVACYAANRFASAVAFRSQCFVLTLLVGIRCGFDNFYEVGRWHFTDTRTVTVLLSAALLYVLFIRTQFSNAERRKNDRNEAAASAKWKPVRLIWRRINENPRYLFFFVPTVMLTILLSLEVRRGFLTAAWGVEGLIVFLAVLKMDERAYRWFSLVLLMLCVGRILTVDVWNLDALGRIVSFLGLGAALLAVSFLYARHREILRRVL